ncbi:MAG TPA: glycoside hydrolase family 3 C-terminal domain-containing protein [Acidobacteriaceae bacterium]
MRGWFHTAVAICLLASVQGFAQAPVADSPEIEHRVDAMLSKLTMEQKIDLLGGKDSFRIGPVPAIGLPNLNMSDGPLAVKLFGTSTVFANGVGLAAAWDPALAQKVGTAMGQEARAAGAHFLLAPGMNIYRSPLAGRNFEYLGEDPLLAGRVAVGIIQGVQSQGVIATAKHFAVNNSEFDRHGSSSDVDERTLREIYLPAFEAAVKEGHVGALMNSYNLINGVHATQNHLLNCQIAKDEWKFDGIIMSDWVATYDGVAAANNCLDVEMPSGEFMNVKTLLPAIADGRVSKATMDDKVRRILRKAVEFGFFDRDQRDLNSPIFSKQHSELALQGSLEGMVLLKNADNVLPLDRKKIRSVAVLGPNAYPAVITGGGSAQAAAFAPVGVLTGIGNYLGDDVKVYYDPRGFLRPKELFSKTNFVADGKPGIKIEVFANAKFAGTPVVSKADHVDSWPGSEFAWRSDDLKSVRYTGSYVPTKTGRYVVMTAANGSDVYHLYLDGKQIAAQEKAESQTPHAVEIELTAGKAVDVRYDVLPNTPSVWNGLAIYPVDELVSKEAVKLAAMADAVIVSAGFDPTTESEGVDRTFELPYGQDALIQAVAAVNPRTIVVLNSGGAVDTSTWIDKVPALLEAWYPGQEGGTAIAQVLFGERSPEGKLPMSWETRWQDNPVHDNYYPNTGEAHHIAYREGVFVGYRYYSGSAVKPAYPFGFGLSYTQFAFSNLKLSTEKPKRGEKVSVSFDVRNTGKREGAEVAQLYLGDPSAKVKRPERELKGFQKVRLAPGESTHVTLELDERAMSYFDVTTHAWKADAGLFHVYVGDSSVATPLDASFTLQP